ncbi:MAG: hypothetical protein ACTSW1_14580 [Candidatus Hodarchaeales archaeon]
MTFNDKLIKCSDATAYLIISLLLKESTTMSPIIVTQERESLLEASEIILKVFKEIQVSSEIQDEWQKWTQWFEKQYSDFLAEKTTNPRYLTQIKRLQEFITEKTNLTEEDLFSIEVKKRELQYDLTKIKIEKPKPLTGTEIDSLIEALYTFLTKTSEIKPNPTIDKLVLKRRKKRLDLPDNLTLDQELDFLKQMDSSQKNYSLVELLLEQNELTQAKELIQTLTDDKHKYSLMTWLAALDNDFSSFKLYFRKAFSETFELETRGPYVLSFLIGNERTLKYLLDSQGRRSLAYASSSGIYHIRRMDVVRSFIDDLRPSPDGRIGIWLRPTSPQNNFVFEDISHLYHKQVIGWKDVSF